MNRGGGVGFWGQRLPFPPTLVRPSLFGLCGTFPVSWCDEGHEPFPSTILRLIEDNFMVREVVIAKVFRCQFWNENPLKTVYVRIQVAKLPATTWHQICLACKLWSNFSIRDKEDGVWVYFNGIMSRYPEIPKSCPIKHPHPHFFTGFPGSVQEKKQNKTE